MVGAIQDNIFLSTPSARRATTDCYTRIKDGQFLSTPSARRATPPGLHRAGREEISIHALREEGDPMRRDALCLVLISIHALREEGDAGVINSPEFWRQFLSTPSARRATKNR